MNNVIRLPRKPRQQSLRGIAREAVTEAIRSVPEPSAAVIVVIAKDGSFALRTVSDGHWPAFDINSRAVSVIERDSRELIDIYEV